MSRVFYEAIGGTAGLPGGSYVEKQAPEFRRAPSDHHVFVATRTMYPSPTQVAGWLDTREVRLRKLRGGRDQPTIDAILSAEKAVRWL